VLALTQNRDVERRAFFRAVAPVLGEILGEKGAAAILDKSTVVLSLTAIDITDEAIARIDAVLPQAPPAP
jgi:Skp family chaperone for outer membrane proteins